MKQQTLFAPERTAIALRPYQRNAINAVFEAWEKHLRVCLQLPTGGGKTIIFTQIVEQYFCESFTETALILVHREELLLQAKAKLESLTGLNIGYIKSGFKFEHGKDCYIASVQTLARRDFNKIFPQKPSLVIIDEAHHVASDSYVNILNFVPDAKILGVTATPERLDGIGLDGVFTHLIKGVDIGADAYTLIKSGYLSEYQIFGLPFYSQQELDKARKQKDRVGEKEASYGESSRDLKAYSSILNTPSQNENAVDMWLEHANGTQTIIFCIDVKHSKALTESFQNRGIPAAHIDGETDSKIRTNLINEFKEGQIKVLCNCMIFTEGFDVPNVETIVILRPTKSLGLWLQMIGRAMRPHTDKDKAKIIDHTLNHVSLGLPDDFIDWKLDHKEDAPKLFYSCGMCSWIHLKGKHQLISEGAKVISETSKDLPTEDESIIKKLVKKRYEFDTACGCCQKPISLSFSTSSIITSQPQPVPVKAQPQPGDVTDDGKVLALVWDSSLCAVHPKIKDFVDTLISRQRTYGYKVGWCYYALLKSLNTLEWLLNAIGEDEIQYFCSRLGYKPGRVYYMWKDIKNFKDNPESLKAFLQEPNQSVH